jgi:putative methyltransferase
MRVLKIERKIYVRINTIRATKEVLKEYNFEETCIPDVFYIKNGKNSKQKEKSQSDIHRDEALVGKIKIQNLSSCFPAYLINPPENSILVDAASDPENKTTHLCSLMNNTGKIHAFEKSFERYITLCEQVELPQSGFLICQFYVTYMFFLNVSYI